jgi:hypothetical protein
LQGAVAPFPGFKNVMSKKSGRDSNRQKNPDGQIKRQIKKITGMKRARAKPTKGDVNLAASSMSTYRYSTI